MYSKTSMTTTLDHNDHWDQFTNLEDTILPADDH